MEKVLRCDCGFEVRTEDDELLVSRARAHAWDVHGMELAREDVLELAVRRLPALSPPVRHKRPKGDQQ